jgi:hypothetical protein
MSMFETGSIRTSLCAYVCTVKSERTYYDISEMYESFTSFARATSDT